MFLKESRFLSFIFTMFSKVVSVLVVLLVVVEATKKPVVVVTPAKKNEPAPVIK
jgi:hypothetical protein